MGGDLTVAGNAVIQGTLTANGGTLTLGDADTDNVVFNADINSHILPNTDNTYDLGSAAKSWRDLHIDGTATFNNLSITGSQTVSATTQSTDKDTGALVVEGGVGVEKNVNVGGNLAVTGTTALTGDTSVTGTLGVTGATNLSSTLGVTGATTLSSTVGVSGATTLSSTLGVTGATTLSNTLGVSGATTLSSTLGVTGATTLSSTLGVSGATTLSSTLGVTGAATLSSTLGVSDTISATLASGTGLAVTANATIGGTLGVTGNSTFGTITAGTWQGTIINPTYGGTGVNNGSKTITLGGDLTTSGAFATTLASTANTNVTLPTTGTLATLANTETFTNKTLTSPVISSIVNTGTLTLPTSTDTLVGRATTDTLTNKTLTSPVISSISNTGTLTLPTSTDTLVGRATTDTLTNKSIDLTNNTLTATSSQIASAVTDETGSGSLVFANSPTLTTPNISSIVNTGTLSLPTSTDTLVGRATTDTLTNKTINLSSNTLQATSAELATAISDETGTGSLVFANSPTLVTPTLGAASATSLSLGTPLSPANGGTGLSTTSAAAAGKILGVAPDGSTHEYKTLTPGTGISIVDTAGVVTITNTGSGSGGGGGGSASGAVAIYRYNATAGQTVFSGVDTSPSPTSLLYVQNYVNVFLNGVKLDDSDFTATNGTSITLNVPCVATDDVDIVAFGAVPQLANAGGLPNYVVGTTAGGTSLEYKQIVAGNGVSIAQGVGSLTISASGASPISAALASFRYIASANQTLFTGVDTNGNPLLFTPGFLYVFVNGVLLAPSLDYTTTSTTTITLTSGCSLSDFVDILAFGQVTTVGLTDSSVTTAKINDSAVTTAKLNDSSVTTAKLNDSSVTTAKIADGSVTSAKLAAGAAVPSQTGNAGLYLTTNGTTASWATSPTGFRNRIINGDMRIDQRNAGASVTPTSSQYTVDRFNFGITQSSKFSVQQNSGSVTPPAGFSNYLGFTSLSAYSVGAGDAFHLQHIIEGYNFADMMFGSASASTINLSFWVRSSLTGTFGGALRNSASDRSYPFSYTVNAANTWEQKTITIAGETTGTWVTNNGVGIRLHFGLGAGSTFSGTAGAWANANYVSATGATSVVGTNGATFYITGVQLEAGSSATEFERRPIGTELALCQRYYYQTVSNEGVGVVYSSTAASFKAKLPVTMRSNPSLTMPTSGAFRGDITNGGKASATAPVSANPNVSDVYWYNTGYSGATAGELVYWTGTPVIISAEL
jgi:hypothetical protein